MCGTIRLPNMQRQMVCLHAHALPVYDRYCRSSIRRMRRFRSRWHGAAPMRWCSNMRCRSCYDEQIFASEARALRPFVCCVATVWPCAHAPEPVQGLPWLAAHGVHSLLDPAHGALGLTVTGNAVTLWCDVQDSILVVGPLGDTIQYPVPPETILVTEVCHRLLVRTGTAVTKRYFVVCPVRKCRHSTRPLGLEAVCMAAFPSPAHIL